MENNEACRRPVEMHYKWWPLIPSSGSSSSRCFQQEGLIVTFFLDDESPFRTGQELAKISETTNIGCFYTSEGYSCRQVSHLPSNNESQHEAGREHHRQVQEESSSPNKFHENGPDNAHRYAIIPDAWHSRRSDRGHVIGIRRRAVPASVGEVVAQGALQPLPFLTAFMTIRIQPIDIARANVGAFDRRIPASIRASWRQSLLPPMKRRAWIFGTASGRSIKSDRSVILSTREMADCIQFCSWLLLILQMVHTQERGRGLRTRRIIF